MKSKINDYCMSCDICQKQKPKRHHQAPLVSIRVEKPWELVGIDVAGPLKETKRGNKYFMIIVDAFSKYLIVRATRDFNSKTTTCFMKEEFSCKTWRTKSTSK